MKWFIFLLVLAGGYCLLTLSYTNLALQGTQQLQQQYVSAGATADRVAAGQPVSKL